MQSLKSSIKYCIITLSFLGASSAFGASDISDCSFNGIPLYGRVQFVEHFADIKVKFVNSFEDLEVSFVDAFPNSCGKWQVVESFPDFKVQIVNSFEDIKVKEGPFPGVN